LAGVLLGVCAGSGTEVKIMLEQSREGRQLFSQGNWFMI
jgi:hypothetical protein